MLPNRTNSQHNKLTLPRSRAKSQHKLTPTPNKLSLVTQVAKANNNLKTTASDNPKLEDKPKANVSATISTPSDGAQQARGSIENLKLLQDKRLLSDILQWGEASNSNPVFADAKTSPRISDADANDYDDFGLLGKDAAPEASSSTTSMEQPKRLQH